VNTLEIEGPGGTVVVPVDDVSVVEVEAQPGLIVVPIDVVPITIEVVERGPQGPQGPPGNSGIAGYDVEIQDITAGDVLAFAGSSWVNKRQTALTDGGNF